MHGHGLGTGNGFGAFLAPGVAGPGALTTRKSVTFNSDATYICELSTTRSRADQISAKGVKIRNSALFSFVSVGNRPLLRGAVFTVINNTATTSIAGTFGNLADGSSFSAGPNIYLVNYEGGTGNDLTLTVQ